MNLSYFIKSIPIPHISTLLFFLFCNSGFQSLYAQTASTVGPGGCRDSLLLWHRAEDFDISSQSRNWNTAFSAGNTSIYKGVTPSIIYTPMIEVEKKFNYNFGIILNDEAFYNTLNINTHDNINIFSVYKPTGNSPDIPLWGNGSRKVNAGRQLSISLITTGKTNSGSQYNSVSYTHSPASSPQVGGVYINNVSINDRVSENIYINGKNVLNHSNSNSTIIANPPRHLLDNRLWISKLDNKSNNLHNSDIQLAEFIVYEGVMEPKERQQVTSYLAIKYGITLPYDYLLSDSTVAWDVSAAYRNYNHNVIGVAYDDTSATTLGINGNGMLRQDSSTSQQDGDYLKLFTNPTTFLNGSNRRALIVGHNQGLTDGTTAYSSITGNSANGLKINRIWRVQSIGFYNDYTIAFDDFISLPTAWNNRQKFLLVADDSAFTTNVRTYPLIKDTALYAATGVSFSHDREYFFTIGVNNFYVNNDSAAPSLFEACARSSVTFNYDGWAAHPATVQLWDTTGHVIQIDSIHNRGLGTNIGVKGSVTFTIPDTVTTGFVLFKDSNGTLLHRTNSVLVIHNPTIDFLPQASPLCATDTAVQLYGFPSGGIFEFFNNNNNTVILSQNNFNASSRLNWTGATDSLRIKIKYKYLDHYTNGVSCTHPKTISKELTFYDNRINTLELIPIVKNGTQNNQHPLTLDTTISKSVIARMSPDLRVDSLTSNIYPYNFSGTFVDSNNIFLADVANNHNPITFSFNNHGCIGEITTNLDVYEGLDIEGLPDTLCGHVDSIIFFRHRDSIYNYDTLQHNGTTNDTIYVYNELINTTTIPSGQQSAIVPKNTATGEESFWLIPSEVYPDSSYLVVKMEYIDLVIKVDKVYLTKDTIIRSNHRQILDTVFFVDRAIPSIVGLSNKYCANGSPDTLKFSHPFKDSSTYFYLRGEGPTGRFTISDTTMQFIQDSIIRISSIYNVLMDTSRSDLLMQLTYKVNHYGCLDSRNDTFTIKGPLDPFFFARSAYCRNDRPVFLQTRNSSGVSERWNSAIGLEIDSIGRAIFKPDEAIIGKTSITHFLEDPLGCTYSFTDTILVKQSPKIEITLDRSPVNTTFCANANAVTIGSIVSQGAISDTVTYSGRGVIDTIFYPSNAGTGTVLIAAEATDINSCRAYDTLRVEVVQLPIVDIDNSFNNIATLGNTNPAEHTYCRNNPAFSIDGSPGHTYGNRVQNIITGNGVIYQNNSYYYDASLVPDSVIVDTVRYTYTNLAGCTNTDSAIIRLNNIPAVSLTADSSVFCASDTTIQLQGRPIRSISNDVATYSGPGVDADGKFSPSNAGTGTKVISYTFKNAQGCEASVSKTIFVREPTKALFSGYNYEYCSGDTITLNSNNDTTNGRYYFYSNIPVIDSFGNLIPNDNTTGLQNIAYVYTDINNCIDTADINVLIHPKPNIQISGLASTYCYNAPEAVISVYPIGSLSAITGDPAFEINGNNIVFKPNVGASGRKTCTYTYGDSNNLCNNSFDIETHVYRTSPPTVTNLDTFLCKNHEVLYITGSPSGGTFSGSSGISILLDSSRSVDSMWSILPYNTGIGTHTVTYTVLNSFIDTTTNVTTICPAEKRTSIKVRPLPNPRFLAPANNTRFCSNDTAVILRSDPLNPVWRKFANYSDSISVTFEADSILVPRPGGGLQYKRDTTYYFDPSKVTPGGVHSITYIATDTTTGCQDSIHITYLVDEQISPEFNLNSVYCASHAPILLNGIPRGGEFIRNDTILTTPVLNFDPSNTNTIIDSITYAAEYGACKDTITKTFTVNPLPQLSFTTTQDTYCLGDTPVVLQANNPAASFDGSPGVLAGEHKFYPNLSGAGAHTITLKYTDGSTGCTNSVSKILHVYGRPNVDFAIDGGCQNDTIVFTPNNDILDLNNTDRTQIVDYITSIQWILSPNDNRIGRRLNQGSNPIDSNFIDTVHHVYRTPGIYEPKLIVVNQDYCTDTQTIRLVISPTVNSYPYEQDFESQNDWFPESRDSSHSLLWEYGADANRRGIDDNTGNQFWITAKNTAYHKDEDAWVYGPCFDLDSLTRPMISLDYWSDTRNAVDGAVLEYQRADGKWEPLGKWDANRNSAGGINWYNSPFISGKPGDQNPTDLGSTGWTAPLGWSGKTGKWENARYKLDNLRGYQDKVRLRMAFASPGIELNDFYDGFAFDNVIVRNRTRNVLLETMANEEYSSMEHINNTTYQMVYSPDLIRDVVLLQYHIEFPSTSDDFYLNNPSLGRNRAYEYGGSPAGRAFIDGNDSITTLNTIDLQHYHFEEDMLESPKFSVKINSFTHNNANNIFNVKAEVQALEDMPFADYRAYVVISEDSLNYPNGSNYSSQVHSVAREDDEFHLDPSQGTANRYPQSWAANEIKYIDFAWDHSNNAFIDYFPNNRRFQAVVFIQNINTMEVFQVATTRDISGYLNTNVNQAKADAQLDEIQHVNLFPNPANDYINLQFDKALKDNYQWKLVDMRGVELEQGKLNKGTEQVTIHTQQYPTGAYILVLYNNNVFTNKQVIIKRP